MRRAAIIFHLGLGVGRAKTTRRMVFYTARAILEAHAPAPLKVKAFEIFRDPTFEDKIREVAGSHIGPLDYAAVHSADAETCAHAPGRAQAR